MLLLYTITKYFENAYKMWQLSTSQTNWDRGGTEAVLGGDSTGNGFGICDLGQTDDIGVLIGGLTGPFHC